MGTLGIFFGPRKFDYRSGYLEGRKEVMMNRVERSCKENGFERTVKDDSFSLQSQVAEHHFTENLTGLKINAKYFLLLLLVLVILYLLLFL